MARSNKNWWTNGDSLWGGETFKVTESDPELFVTRGDMFRLEKHGGTIELIPHPDNRGGWEKSHDKKNPVKLEEQKPPAGNNQRVLSMKVTVPILGERKFFLLQLENGEILLKKDKPEDPRQNGGTASARR